LKSYGALLANNDRFDEAIFYTNIATKIDPHDAEASCNLGILHNTQKHYDEAIVCFEYAGRLFEEMMEFVEFVDEPK
jgi:tetratricopeptide (TPR) repeat protein